MRVECGRARGGVGSGLRALLIGAFALLGLFACGNNLVYYGTPVITFSVTPGRFTSYIVDIEGVTLTRSDGTISNLFGSNNITTLERVDLTQWNNLTEVFGAPAVVTGTYTEATITVDYTNAQITRDVNGQVQNLNVIDPGTGTTALTVTYTFTFDPAHQLVINNNEATQVDLNFDLSASTLLEATSTDIAAVRPYLTISTAPTITKPLRSRGIYVTGDPAAGTFTMNARPFFDDASNPFGAITVQTTDQTAFNVNGANYVGAAGLAAVNALQVNTQSAIAAYGSLGNLAAPTQGGGTAPVFNATEVIAGTGLESFAADRVIGTVTSRTASSINVHGALVVTRPGEVVNDVATTQEIVTVPDLPVPISSSTFVVVDGQPLTNANIQSISVGQQVDLQGQAICALPGGGTEACATLAADTGSTTGVVASVDATLGFVRLTPTTAWGSLLSVQPSGTAAVNLISLGGFEPSVFTFTGTGSAAGEDANPTNYVLGTGSLDLAAIAPGTVLQVSGLVTPFGSAPPDFTASGIIQSSATQPSAVEQVLEINWAGNGSANPFLATPSAAGLQMNIAADVGSVHEVRTGPLTVDLTNPAVNVLIVPDTTKTDQLTIGNPATNSTSALFTFNEFGSFVTKLNSYFGAGSKTTLAKIVAVGQYNATTGTFTAYRIDIVTQP